MCLDNMMWPMMFGMFFVGGLGFGAGILLVLALWKRLSLKRKTDGTVPS